MNRRVQKFVGIAVAAIVGIALLIAIGGVVVMLLWNWLAPDLFGWSRLGFWQAVGLLALCRILFGGIGPLGGRWSGGRRRKAERWERMTPEERERLHHGLHDRPAPPAGV